MGNWECDCNVIAKRACGGHRLYLDRGGKTRNKRSDRLNFVIVVDQHLKVVACSIRSSTHREWKRQNDESEAVSRMTTARETVNWGQASATGTGHARYAF